MFILLLFIMGCGATGDRRDDDHDVPDIYPEFLVDQTESAFSDPLWNEVESTEEVSQETGIYPDPSFVYKPEVIPQKIKDELFLEDYSTMYRTKDKLEDLHVQTLIYAKGKIWAGTQSGLYMFDLAKDMFIKVDGFEGNVVDIHGYPGDDSPLAVAFTDHVKIMPETGGKEFLVIESPETKAIYIDDEKVYISGGSKLFVCNLDGNGCFSVDAIPARDLAVFSGKVYLATMEGIKVIENQMIKGSLTKASNHLLDDDVRGLFIDHKDKVLYVATANGLSIIEVSSEKPKALVGSGKGKLPTDKLTGIAVLDDIIVIGHEIGGTVTDKGFVRFDHYVSNRWLPDNKITSVTVSPDGSRWFGTLGGITRIQLRQRTIKEKAKAMQEELDAHYWRMDGFVSPDALLDDPWKPTSWHLTDSDNDGLWTQMMIGGWCYAYAVTKDEKFYKYARKAIETMFLLIDIPAIDFEKKGLGRGFVARSLVRDDEGVIFDNKKDLQNWHKVQYQGRYYYWKDDTSSDETTGHFFGYALYYDLCAKDDKEREEVAEHAGALANYILKNNFRLIDLDGEETTWGHWQPERIAIAVDGLDECVEKTEKIEWCVEAYAGGGWLNAVEILGHMLSAWHMTKDSKFYDAYDMLITKYRYNEVARFSENILTVVNPSTANHSDHELAMLAFATLIRYEPNDARRKEWIESFLNFYSYEIPERNPLWTAIVAMISPKDAKVADGVQSLREMPLDLRIWGVDNSHRKDALIIGKDRFGEPQFDTVFPYDEIRTMWWNGNPYKVKENGNGKSTEGPMAFLLAYWAQRFAGILD